MAGGVSNIAFPPPPSQGPSFHFTEKGMPTHPGHEHTHQERPHPRHQTEGETDTLWASHLYTNKSLSSCYPMDSPYRGSGSTSSPASTQITQWGWLPLGLWLLWLDSLQRYRLQGQGPGDRAGNTGWAGENSRLVARDRPCHTHWAIVQDQKNDGGHKHMY